MGNQQVVIQRLMNRDDDNFNIQFINLMINSWWGIMEGSDR